MHVHFGQDFKSDKKDSNSKFKEKGPCQQLNVGGPFDLVACAKRKKHRTFAMQRGVWKECTPPQKWKIFDISRLKWSHLVHTFH